MINTTGISTYRNNVPAGSVGNTLIPVKVSYLKSLLSAFYLSNTADATISTRQCPFAQTGGYYSWNIGGNQIPSAPIQVGEKGVEPQLELLKCLKNLTPFESNLLGTTYKGATFAIDATSATFALGGDFEKFSPSDSLL